MRRWTAALFAAGLLLPGVALAHAMPNSVLMVDLGADAVSVEATLPWAELKYALPADLAEPPQRLEGPARQRLGAYVLAHIGASSPDGRAWSARLDGLQILRSPDHADLSARLSLRPPPGPVPDRFVLHEDAVTHVVMSHVALVFVRGGGGLASGEPRLAGALQNPANALPVAWNRSPRSGFVAALMLGVGHIAGGTDHLLFLLTLLLPAPLLAVGGRWGGVQAFRPALTALAATVTAFTLGHSITLIAGALFDLSIPQKPVEAAIAASILVAAAAAWRPLGGHGRVGPWVAAGFGLIHGLAFAAVLGEYRLTPAAKAWAIAGFNLGIEAVQMGLVLVAGPLLILLARTPAYGWIRRLGALAAGAAAMVWLVQRLSA